MEDMKDYIQGQLSNLAYYITEATQKVTGMNIHNGTTELQSLVDQLSLRQESYSFLTSDRGGVAADWGGLRRAGPAAAGDGVAGRDEGRAEEQTGAGRAHPTPPAPAAELYQNSGRPYQQVFSLL